jgi:MYXO-CTERM domain-containing protein
MRLGTALVVLALSSHTAYAQWDTETPVTSTGSDVWGEGLASSGSTVYMIYGTNEVRFRSSTDEGATWSTDKQIDTGLLHLTDPMVADGDDVWVLEMKNISSQMDWCCPRDVGDLYLLHSGNRGQTWDAPKRLTTGAQAYRYSIAYAADRLHVVWMDFRSGAWDTYYLRSSNRGAAWDAEKDIAKSTNTFGAERPQVAVRGDGVHVTIWDDRGTNPPCMAGPTFSFSVCPDTFYIGSLDGGTTWSTEVPVSYSGAAIAGRNDVAVAGTSSVVINFNRSAENSADNNPHMFVARSGDNGATWDPALQLNDTPGQADHGSIIGDGADVHLAWHDSRDGALAIYYTLSRDEGRTWIAEERASTATGTDSSTPLVAVTPGYAHVMWLDHRSGTYQIYYRRRAIAALPAGADAGTPGDGGDGNGETSPKRGCGCRTSSDSGSILLIIGVAFVLRRRRGLAASRANLGANAKGRIGPDQPSTRVGSGRPRAC